MSGPSIIPQPPPGRCRSSGPPPARPSSPGPLPDDGDAQYGGAGGAIAGQRRGVDGAEQDVVRQVERLRRLDLDSGESGLADETDVFVALEGPGDAADIELGRLPELG